MGNLRDRRQDTSNVASQDFHGRRIKNASPSEDPYDYVVKKEMDEAIKKAVKSTSTSPGSSVSSGFVYVFRIVGSLYSGSNLAGKRLILSSSKPTLIHFELDVNPTGHSLDLVLYQDTSVYLSQSITTSMDVSIGDIGAAGALTSGSNLSISITAVGSTIVGSGLVCTVVQ